MKQLTNQTIFSISHINKKVKFSLNENFSDLWIKGEVSSFKTYPSGHSYLTLKDELSEISAVIFNQYSISIDKMPVVGSEVLVMGDLSIYEPRGQFQLQIKNLYLSGEGELWLSFENLKKKLESEGLFDIDKKKKLPKFPQKIGIITSSEGAVLRDILQIINRRSPHLICHIYPVSVQGKNSAKEIAIAIKDMNFLNEVDLLIVGRGGGSMEDLWSFNDEIVVRAIFDSKLPVISAVGHETDTTLSDFVADVRAPTPSAAAELASINKNEILQTLDHLQEKLIIKMEMKISNYIEKITTLSKRHAFYKPNLLLDSMQNKLLEKINVLFHVVQNNFLEKVNDFKLIKDKLNLLNPEAQLERGYALAINEKGKVMYNAKDIAVDDEFKLKLAHGQLQAKVLTKRNDDV